MNTYYVFWIKEEFIDHLFYKGVTLYQFLNCYLHKKDNPNLLSQYTYITNRFSKTELISHIRMERQNRVTFKVDHNKVEIYNDLQYISLHIDEKHLLFQCETLLDAEELLLSSLRKFNPHLFIVGQDIENFGWISPAIKREKYKTEQQLTLSSYL